MRLERISPEAWNKIAEDAHFVCHKEIRPKDQNTIDYAVVVYDDEKLMAYATIIEMEKRVAHMQHGGAFPGTQGSANSFRAYKSIIMHLSEFYDALITNIENTNTVMLKFALKIGFIPVGIDCHTFGIYEGTYLHMYRDNLKEREQCGQC